VEPQLAHRGRIDTLRFWPDGKRLVSGSSDQTLCVWDLAHLPDIPEPLRLRGHRRPIQDVALLPDNSTLVSGCEDGTVFLWNTTQPRQDHSHIALSGAFVAWRWAADSRSVITLDANGRVVRWHGVDFQEATTLMETGPNLFPGTFSADLGRLATGSAEGKLQVWDLTQGKLLTEFKGRLWPRTFLSQGDSLLVKDTQDGRIKEWSLAEGQALRSWETQGRLLGSILSADDRRLIRLMERGRLLLTDRTTNQVVELDPSMPGAYGSAFSADGKHVAVASYLGMARVWETTTGREVATFRGTQQGVHAAGFSPDGRRLVTCSQGAEAIRLWDLESRRELLTLAARDQIFISTEFSPNANLLGAMHHAGALHLWRVPSWEDIATAEARQGPQRK
jgi:WD40 repeat protein